MAFTLGAWLVARTLLSVVRTFVLPRSASDRLARAVFVALRLLFRLRLRKATTYEERDSIMALYAPFALLTLLPVWLVIVWIGYAGMYWALGVEGGMPSLRLSGSSLLTLGFSQGDGLLATLLVFSEATIGLILAALLIAYLPTMYSAFSQREAAVNLLEVRAGSPPSAVTMISRLWRIGRFDHLAELWVQWEQWFVYVEETHTSLAALALFRSPQPNRSWVTASGAVLDAAALVNSVVDTPHDARADLCIRAGYLALRQIADFFEIEFDDIPPPGDPDAPHRVSITRQEFDEACAALAAEGVPLKADRDQGWRDFAGWRITYDQALLGLAALTMAPYAPWSSDRSLPRRRGRRRIPNVRGGSTRSNILPEQRTSTSHETHP